MTVPGDGDVLLRGGLVLDGSGEPGRTADVLVADGRVAVVGTSGDPHVAAPAGARVIDADGLAIAPGFIDMHAHSDLAVLTDHDHLAKVSQGVTTEVLGQDGLSYAPATEATMPVIREQIAGWNGVPADVDFAWRSVGEYLRAVDDARPPTNVAYLVPQGSVRMAVVGTDDRPATSSELARMRRLVDDGMRDGAFGMSSGLTYVPGMFASTDELVALCEVVASHGGFYAPHQRSYGAGALDAYAEMIDIAARARCALHLTHATMNFDVNRGRAGELVELIDRGIAAGVDITLDSYPYLSGATTLAALLPSWSAVGGPDATIDRMRDPGIRERVVRELEVTGSDGCHGVPVDWATIEIAGVRNPQLAPAVGHTIAALGARDGQRPSEVFLELLVADRLGTSILQHVGDEQNVRTMMRHPRHTGGSDGILIGAKPHPRGWGTFPRYLGRYVREEGVLTLEDAIVHLSARPAARLGLTDRGRIAPGAVADLVLFDPARVSDRATYDDPRRTAAGIPWVFVAGVPVIDDGTRTAHRPGRALRHRSPARP
ncbi:N-acyl-D-amino-acid deacylase family protein [Leifsonia poae]|uniref:N-acyl-D-amino-acid deacylase n=1 Tax=Leifsonia poae TaxID=110933 RepID=A0A9W6LZJ6_9MICO|nr:D-aminoacylase [Leifsonia poae]GLJ75946.1 N-acyl-D-amino-acid deacylase [Leifsonia poae]